MWGVQGRYYKPQLVEFFGSLMPLFSVDETISRTESRGGKKAQTLKVMVTVSMNWGGIRKSTFTVFWNMFTPADKLKSACRIQHNCHTWI